MLEFVVVHWAWWVGFTLKSDPIQPFLTLTLSLSIFSSYMPYGQHTTQFQFHTKKEVKGGDECVFILGQGSSVASPTG